MLRIRDHAIDASEPLSGLSGHQTTQKDLNCDGNKDVLAFWRVRSLVRAGALGKKTTELNLTADLTDGGCIKGTDSVKPKWRKKRKRKCWQSRTATRPAPRGPLRRALFL